MMKDWMEEGDDEDGDEMGQAAQSCFDQPTDIKGNICNQIKTCKPTQKWKKKE